MKAFPKTSSYDENNGMDLRDYFAAKVLTSLVRRITATSGRFTAEDFVWCSEESYRFADAMMEAREK